jgi:hypothetical protein
MWRVDRAESYASLNLVGFLRWSLRNAPLVCFHPPNTNQNQKLPRRRPTTNNNTRHNIIKNQTMAVSEADRRQRKKTKIFDESGLTDADRRVVRSEQRTLQEGMIDGSIGWKEGREANNAIFEDRVAYSRELVIDVENTTLALTGFAKEVEATVQVSWHG